MISHLKELYSYRELLLNLVKRELKVKYKRSVFGFLWSFLNPLVLLVVYSIIFGRLFGMDRGISAGFNGVKSFSAYLLTGLLAWSYLANSLIMAVGSIVDSGNLIKKIYFPRVIIPFASVFANLVNFGLELVVLFIFLSVLGIYFYVQIPFLIVIILIETLIILGLSALVSLANVYFRDMKHLIQIVIQVWFFACPIIYPYIFVSKFAASNNLSWLPSVYLLNPMASVTVMYQKVFYFVQMPSFKMLVLWFSFAVVFFLASLAIFKAKEDEIASEV
ncbi:MAG: ABC transporter permease [Actinobacteria bacterium]|nr:MAG: ABC transporter permease [Actinomycetota bacterium]